MRQSEKSKRLSWAPDFNLCQVRLFLSDESPAQVGLATQDHLQAKSSWVSQPIGAGVDDNLPPGFEGSHPTDLLKNKLSQISLAKWICPPKFVFDATWQVVAGEESKEVELQKHREMGILEAVYPRPSAIPPNPSALTDLETSLQNELNIPIIPVTPIEEEDTTIEDPSAYTMYTTAQNATSSLSQPPQSTISNGNTSNMMAQAAQAVLNAVASSNNSQANTIDPNLLMKILNDPKWHERLIAANPSSPGVQQTSRVGPSSGPPLAKDLSYYKSLIQKHGGEKSEGAPNDRQNTSIGASKKLKLCVYFNSSRGCRKGASCPYQHDASALQSAKRVKLDREINGE